MILDLATWWRDLSLFEQVYWIIALPATLLFLIQLVITFIGFDHDIDTDGGFHLITVKNLIAFFSIFAWSGLACIDIFGQTAYGITIVVSTVAGLLMMFIMALLYYFVSKLTQTNTLDLHNAIAETGEVYISIPEKKTGMGKIQVKVQGAIRTLDAVTDELEPIKTGSVVEVADVINDRVLLVRRSR